MIFRLRPIPEKINPFNINYLLVTWFHSGRIRPASGSWGSLAALPVCWLIALYAGHIGLGLFAMLIYCIGIYVIKNYLPHAQSQDPSEVVIDEVLGVTLLFFGVSATNPMAVLVGFCVFRILDSLKPGPIGWCDRHIKGAHGVMLDDVVAGALTAIILFFARVLAA